MKKYILLLLLAFIFIPLSADGEIHLITGEILQLTLDPTINLYSDSPGFITDPGKHKWAVLATGIFFSSVFYDSWKSGNKTKYDISIQSISIFISFLCVFILPMLFEL